MRRSRRLNSDELGATGEPKFQSLCADAKLICNKSQRDRTGWDFIVEFPFDPTPESVPLDKRSAPISCHFQTKTMWEQSDTFKMRLSSAERLAKEVKPSFIYVLRINDELELHDAFLIHIIGSPLAAILKKLRAEESTGNRKRINKKCISMTVTKYGQKLAPTGVALRAALVSLCDSNPHRYVDSKRRQMEELGFTFPAYTTEMTLHLADQDELIDFFLGLKPHVEVSDVKTREARFGIDLPSEPTFLSGGKLSLDLQSNFRCVITYRQEKLARPSLFEGSIVFAPPAIVGQSAALFKTDFFNMRYVHNAIDFQSSIDVTRAHRCSLDQWRGFFNMSCGLAKGIGEFSIKADGFPSSLKFRVRQPTTGGMDSNFCKSFIGVLESLIRISEAAGLSSDFHPSFEEIRLKTNHILTLDTMLLGHFDRVTSIRMLSEPHMNVTSALTVDMAYVNSLTIGPRTIGYAVRTEMVATPIDDAIEWTSSKRTFYEMSSLDGSKEHFEQYAASMRTAMGVNGLLIPGNAANQWSN